MSTQSFICYVLGVCSFKIDQICEDFNIDLTQEDIAEALDFNAGGLFSKETYSNVGNFLIRRLYDKIISLWSDKLIEECFYANIEGGTSNLYYDDEVVCSSEDLNNIWLKKERKVV